MYGTKWMVEEHWQAALWVGNLCAILVHISHQPLKHLLFTHRYTSHSFFLSCWSDFFLTGLNSVINELSFQEMSLHFSTPGSVTALFPLLLYHCVLIIISMTPQGRNFRKGFRTLHKHLSRCLFLLKTKPNQKPVPTLHMFTQRAWCMAGACLCLPIFPCVHRRASWG